MKTVTEKITGLDIQGNLIAADITPEILAGEIKGQNPESFGCQKSVKLADEIATAWGDAQVYWMALQRALNRLPEDDLTTTVTREQWVIPLLRSLGYNPVYVAKAEVVEGLTYAISHRAEGGENKPPIHIIGSRLSLEKRPPTGTPRLSAHALLQEYLNRTEHLWGIVTNGLKWRLLRDSSLMTRLTYIEFDLEQILAGENFAEFGLFYRLFHRSRLPQGIDDVDECLLEFYHQESLQRGGRVRDRLRDGVESALKILGKGFLQHPDNGHLRERFISGIGSGESGVDNIKTTSPLDAGTYYRQLLKLIYRLLFLMVAESRNLLISTDDLEKVRIYREYYSLERLRLLAEKLTYRREGYQDYWQGLRVTFQLFDENWRGQLLGLSPLDGDLFGSHSLADLDDCAIDNHDLISAIRQLSLYENKGQLRRVNYGALDVEELGSVYESLLDFTPKVTEIDGIWQFDLVIGSDRKTTGSYYTPPELVGQLIKSALEPVIEDRLNLTPQPPLLRGEGESVSPLLRGEGESVSPLLRGEGESVSPLLRGEGLGEVMKEIARKLRKTATKSEQILWEALRNRRLDNYKFRRQHPIGSFVVDFFCHQENLIVEVDGSIHDLPEQQELDRERQQILELLGYGFVRVSAHQVETDLPQVLKTIRNALLPSAKPSPIGIFDLTPSPSPSRRGEQEKALLSIKVCDPACGSGHFLLAAARRIGKELAKVRTGEPQPSPESLRQAIRDVIQHCIYGVDLNPLAVDLCKVALWLEGLCKGFSLNFLDHRIKCGNSLVGVMDLDVLKEGIPDNAYKAVTGDDKNLASRLKKENKNQKKVHIGQLSLFEDIDFQERQGLYSSSVQHLDKMEDNTSDDYKKKQRRYQELRKNNQWWQDYSACNLWTCAFFMGLTEANLQLLPTTEALKRLLKEAENREKRSSGGQISLFGQGETSESTPFSITQIVESANKLAEEYRFFHWCLEFPEVFNLTSSPSSTSPPAPLLKERGVRSPRPVGEGLGEGGFDCILGNPPWERIKLQEKEFFASKDSAIANAKNKAARTKLINKLAETNPNLLQEFENAKHFAEAQSKFIRESGRFPLTAKGDINTYAIFAETVRNIINNYGRCGVIVPTGIATDNTTKDFFGDLIKQQSLASLYDFENREAIFSSVHRSYKFSLLVMSNKPIKFTNFAFFLTNPKQLDSQKRVFTLAPQDIALINPNTLTCPVFRTKADADLTKKIYQRIPVLENESTGENPWGISFMAMFHMANDSHLFHLTPQPPLPLGDNHLTPSPSPTKRGENDLLTTEQYTLQGEGEQDFSLTSQPPIPKDEGESVSPLLAGEGLGEVKLPLYEAKMFHQFDHRWASYDSQGNTHDVSLENKNSPKFTVTPRYWVDKKEVENRLGNWNKKWLLGFRDITNSTNERTAIFSLLPKVAVNHKAPLVLLRTNKTQFYCLFLANVNSLVFDFILRQKIGGTSLSYFILKQLPVIPPENYSQEDIEYISSRVLELVYTANDLKPFAEDMGYEGKPFIWDEERRAILRAELDAKYAQLYGLTRDELRYILDPADIYGEDFPSETFRVLKNNEMKKYGEYRTQRLVLEAWDKMGY